jgi:hypothetical protein
MRMVGFWVMAVLVVGSCSQEAARPPDDSEGDSGGSGGVTKTGGKGGTKAGGAGGGGKGGASSGGAGGDASGGSPGAGGDMTPDAGADAPDDSAAIDAATEDMADDVAGDDAGDAIADDGGDDAADAADDTDDTGDTGDAGDMADDVAAPNDAHAGRALLVVGALPPTAADMLILARVQGKTMVDVMLETEATTEQASGRPLVLIPASASVAGTGAKFANVPVPVIIFEPNLLGTMKMTGDVNGTDRGALANQTKIDIIDPASPLAAGLSGTVAVYDPMSASMAGMSPRLTWGVPGANALKVATIVGAATHIVIFAYPAGVEMVQLTAPAKRLAFFIHDNATTLTADGETLLDAAIDWSLQ